MDTVTAHELAGRVRRRNHVRLSATTAQAFLEDWLPVGIAEQVNGGRALRNLVFRPVYLPRPRVRVDLEAAVKRSADRAGLSLRVGVVVFDSFDEQTTTYALEDVPSLEVFLRLEDVLRILGNQRGGLDLVHESPHEPIIA